MKSVLGRVFDFSRERFCSVRIFFKKGVIVNIQKEEGGVLLILPGLIDSHVHIESSMLVPSRFSELAVRNGVVSVVTDPHEIANVLGVSGVEYMIQDSKNTPLKIYFGVPSCVPATAFETSGAVLDSEKVNDLLKRDEVVVLSEMMNFPGVLFDEEEVCLKINFAKKNGKPIDGHAPGLRGENLNKYISSGISTDHEACSYEEAKEKIQKGMMIQIREGSSAKNFDELYPLIDEFPDNVMLCTDDSHPDDLQKGYINKLVRKGIERGVSFKNIYKAAFFNTIKHYDLSDIGQLRIGDKADFIVVDNEKSFKILKTVINGVEVFDGENVKINSKYPSKINNFKATEISKKDIVVTTTGGKMKVIKAFEGELITDSYEVDVTKGIVNCNLDDDILKVVVVNRYVKKAKPVVGFINGFGIKKGAFASSIAHDSHNIIAIGVDDDEIVNAINKLIGIKGGIVVVDKDYSDFLQLDVAGLMSVEKPEFVISKYSKLNNDVIRLGSTLRAPFMTLAFMSLLVIPKLKIGDKGLFDVTAFSFTDLISKK